MFCVSGIVNVLSVNNCNSKISTNSLIFVNNSYIMTFLVSTYLIQISLKACTYSCLYKS